MKIKAKVVNAAILNAIEPGEREIDVDLTKLSHEGRRNLLTFVSFATAPLTIVGLEQTDFEFGLKIFADSYARKLAKEARQHQLQQAISHYEKNCLDDQEESAFLIGVNLVDATAAYEAMRYSAPDEKAECLVYDLAEYLLCQQYPVVDSEALHTIPLLAGSTAQDVSDAYKEAGF